MTQDYRIFSRIVWFVGLCCALIASPSVRADTTTITPKGEFTKINTRLAEETIQILAKGSAEEKKQAIKKIKASPGNYAPTVFYVLSNVLFLSGEKDEGAFWFYAGQLRARIDANICADASARQAVSVLNQSFGPLINQYTLQDITKLEALIPRVVDWERNTPYNYDRRWINLHGMRAVMSGMDDENEDSSSEPLSKPNDQWKEIAEKTRIDYMNKFLEAMAREKGNKK